MNAMTLNRNRGDVEQLRDEAIKEGIQMLRKEFKEYATVG